MDKDWIIDGNEDTVRDTLLTMGNFLFRKKEYKRAGEFFECAHKMHKTVLSGFMSLCCSTRNDVNDDILKSFEEASFIAKLSEANDEKLDEFRFKIRSFLIAADQELCEVEGIKAEIRDFEAKLWPWIIK